MQTPYKYRNIHQHIQEQLHTTLQETTIEIQWIPGHTNYKWNELADKLAKKAAEMWLLPRNRALEQLSRNFRPSLDGIT